jgi:hypothetical protein
VGFIALYLMIPYFLPVLDRLFTGGIETLVLVLRAFAVSP